jgi:endoglucanase
MLYFAEDNPQAWIGWTYWAAGSWWGANWFSAQPREGVDPPQLTILLNHIAKH